MSLEGDRVTGFVPSGYYEPCGEEIENHAPISPRNNEPTRSPTTHMKRRDLIQSAGVSGLFVGLSGCSALSGGSDPTNTPTAKDNNTKTATATPTDTVTPTASQDIREAIAKTRTELAAAFEAIHAMEFHRGDRLLADPEKFKQYDPEKALFHVESVRGPLATINQHADNKSLKTQYAILAGLALIAEEGAKLYDKLRKTFRETWQYEYAYEHAHYKKGVEQLGNARTFLTELPMHRNEVADGIESIAGLPMDPRVEGFDLQTWADIEASIKAQTPALSATFKGFETYTDAVIYDNQGLNALDNDDPEAAYKLFQKAINTVNDSMSSLGKAKDRDATYFDKRLDAFFCRAPGMEEAYTFNLQAADALADGDGKKAVDLRQKGLNKMGEAIENCPEDQ